MNVRKKIAAALTFIFLLSVFVMQLEAGWLKDLKKNFGKNIGKTLKKTVKVVAIGALVKSLAKPLNSFINTFTANQGAKNKAYTRVVPILTLGQGMVIGAAQVQGPPELVEQVKSVIALETRFAQDNRFHIKAYVPNSKPTPIGLDRVQGVGVSAIIDYKL
ncbi:hypothetical protein ACFL35_00440 [Candidatus Riflebacteria bacterium]